MFLSPLSSGGPGEGPDCFFWRKAEVLGPIPAGVRWGNLLFMLILAQSAVGIIRFLKAVWPDFWECVFEGFPAPPGAGQTSKMHPKRSGQTAFKYPALLASIEYQ